MRLGQGMDGFVKHISYACVHQYMHVVSGCTQPEYNCL
jgi:hypothetical protein